MSRNRLAVLVVVILVFGIYGWLLSLSLKGYGYIGYRSYRYGPSPFYWGHSTTYYHQDYGGARGLDVRGGGPRAGK